MNAIIDLTARAVSFVTTVQTTLLHGAVNDGDSEEKLSILTIPLPDFETQLRKCILSEKAAGPDRKQRTVENNFCARAAELVWVSRNPLKEDAAQEYAIKLCVALAGWIWQNSSNGLQKSLERYGPYPTPYNWRESISRILYEQPTERLRLAAALQYLPIQIVLALGAGNRKAWEQRIWQMWQVDQNDRTALLAPKEEKVLDECTKAEQRLQTDAETLLKDDQGLCNQLLSQGVPLAFENVLQAELEEIEKNRRRRSGEQNVTGGSVGADNGTVVKSRIPNPNPLAEAKEMHLYGLALSGGGIRSATFNLGILQGLAKQNLLCKVDYLSSVSGGGYVASWLAGWIKRDGSVVKVTNRLCPDKSPDPLGEELKPIRWLRMFSNYLSPNASIMSADAWTAGITWFRNTLLNQLIIFLMLITLLFAGNLLFLVWSKHLAAETISYLSVFASSAGLLIPVALLAGLGMHAYHSEKVRWVGVKREQNARVSRWITVIAYAGAFLVSAWLSHVGKPTLFPTFYSKTKILLPAAGIAFIAMLIVSLLGRYVENIKEKGAGPGFAWFILILTTAFAAGMGLLSLSFAWGLLQKIDVALYSTISDQKETGILPFIFGVPLILEAFSITIVARMALLGKYFPDERREWWGRIGAYVHRMVFTWILIAASALLGEIVLKNVFHNWWTGLAATGGWMAMVGSTVRSAFSAKTKGTKDPTAPSYLSLLSATGPYLFLLGLLIFLPALLLKLVGLEKQFARGLFGGIFLEDRLTDPQAFWLTFVSIVVYGSAAFFLAWRIGVNEFSMHHFYRNRLVRAYLGATRRSTDRQRTANPFTGFDNLDDEPLSKLTHEQGYDGPYPILNTALNASQVTALDRQDRKAESFIFSPLYCGFDFSMIRASADAKTKSYDYAYRPTGKYAGKGGPSLGTAMTTSGAAVNPNQGYHSSAATAFLLTVFNAQLGLWIGNPRKGRWERSDPRFGLGYILNNLVGKTDTQNRFVALSDGGHFDNMGLYELIRRKCRYIILCDAEQDDSFTCEGFANAIRRCRIDFGADIAIDISKITTRTEERFSAAHYALGKIWYAGESEPSGRLLYIKSSILGKEPVDVREYALKNTTFPHQTTADQFFDEEQFESYRKLGLYIAGVAFTDEEVATALNVNLPVKPKPGIIEAAESLLNKFSTAVKGLTS